jgi:hypothetical protein
MIMDVDGGVLHKVFQIREIGHDNGTVQGPVADSHKAPMVRVAQHLRHIFLFDIIAVETVKRGLI